MKTHKHEDNIYKNETYLGKEYSSLIYNSGAHNFKSFTLNICSAVQFPQPTSKFEKGVYLKGHIVIQYSTICNTHISYISLR